MPVPIKTGTVLRNRYQFKKIIGQGGMGSIYLSEDLRLEGRLCAIKEVGYDRALPNAMLKEAREQFQREATVLARLDHPNLPKVSDFFSIQDRDYLVMDYIPGKDLRELIIEAQQKNTFLPEEDVLDWAIQIADALKYLHTQENPIVHRDIKPSNLKLTPNGLVKLVDFGLVKMKRLPHIGSDHFPIYVVLQTGRIFEQKQQELEQTESDEDEAQQAIQEGIAKAEQEEKVVVDELAQTHKSAMIKNNN